MKSFRLKVHQKTFSGEDLLVNPKDYPEAKEGDIVEIYHPTDDENPRLLLQIKSFKDDVNTAKDTLSVEQTVASSFNLKKEKDVCVRIVEPADVALDSIELTFKDQYMGRSEMWRLKKILVHSCVYINKKLEFCNGAIRYQVYEMWSMGERVACGVITEDTKMVFRSLTSMVYLFLQMSSEMWDFDIYGDLYFEKAVNGFLSDLFMKWKKNGSNHEVTIVLFSRTFYQANSLEEFPLCMRECLQKDYKGRYYEDFYRVAVQNEKYDDWCGVLVQLRRLFSEYLKIVLKYHHPKDGETIPKATNSTAADGNFLEVLNMSLNVFEKHYLDRSFDRTGQLSVVITPGVGIFEVDRELANITKQRIIDNGVGSDLVCVGEQPLHAVPLLKFHNKDTQFSIPDDYSMPHWINLSFYSTNRKLAYSNFVPRIKLPSCFIDEDDDKNCTRHINPTLVMEDNYLQNTFFDYDAYDAQVFQTPAPRTIHEFEYSQKSAARYKRTSGSLLEPQDLKWQRRKLSDPDTQYVQETSRSQPISIPAVPISPVVSPRFDDKPLIAVLERDVSPPLRMVVGSEGSPSLESRALINPFDPSHVTIKLTSNRRRWTHIFPKGPSGVLIQQHHYQAIPTESEKLPPENKNTQAYETKINQSKMYTALHEYCRKEKSLSRSAQSKRKVPVPPNNRSKALLWGATGEQEWTPALTTVNEVLIGVDWKSLTIPACLPITTDYFPDIKTLQHDYLVSLYNLLPEDVNVDAQQRGCRRQLNTMEVFHELVSQRLAQGFQLVLMPPGREHYYPPEADILFNLSIGRGFHKVFLQGNTVHIHRYRPRHPYPGFNYQYRYRFHAPHHENYEESYASFTTEKLDHYNWNFTDHYICARGDLDFQSVDNLKIWRFRVYLLPLNNAATKRIVEGSQYCDIYNPMTSAEHQQMVEGFLKFTETVVNKIKRYSASKKPRMSLSVANHNAPFVQPRRNSMSAVNQSSTSCNSPFRERLGSNRLPDRPRPRSGSKVMERGRASPAIETLQQQMIETQSQDSIGSEENVSFDPILKASSTYGEILESMRNPSNGLSFVTITALSTLPAYTFISADAVNWLVTHMEGLANIGQATQIFVKMQRDNLICHASGIITEPFLYGFRLYYIPLPNRTDEKYYIPCNNQKIFQSEWMEAEVKPALNWGLSDSTNSLNIPMASNDREQGIPHFLCEEIDTGYLLADIDTSESLYKRTYLDIDATCKSDRPEWGHITYHKVFRPDQAYEIIVNWLVASGSIVSELLMGWARKVQSSCGFQMVPIPHDPLALPYSDKSDPLRGPIFVPLNLNCLGDPDLLFKNFRRNTPSERFFLFQEAIICKFGFIPCLVDLSNASGFSQDHQYIHATGTVFILISSPPSANRKRFKPKIHDQFGGKYAVQADAMPSPHEAYITRHVSGKNKDIYDNSKRMGFLWSWNHMISRRWRSNQAVDNNFQTKLLKDFKEFCSNSNNRLKIFWDECWEIKDTINT